MSTMDMAGDSMLSSYTEKHWFSHIMLLSMRHSWSLQSSGRGVQAEGYIRESSPEVLAVLSAWLPARCSTSEASASVKLHRLVRNASRGSVSSSRPHACVMD